MSSSIQEIANIYEHVVNPTILVSYCKTVIEDAVFSLMQINRHVSNEDIKSYVRRWTISWNNDAKAIPENAFIPTCMQIAKSDHNLQYQMFIEAKSRYEECLLKVKPEFVYDVEIKSEKIDGNNYLIINGLSNWSSNMPLSSLKVDIKGHSDLFWNITYFQRLDNLYIKLDPRLDLPQGYVTANLCFHFYKVFYEKKVKVYVSNETPFDTQMALWCPMNPIVCPICLGDFQGGGETFRTSPCGHSFCNDCITTWVSQSNACPYCRQKLIR